MFFEGLAFGENPVLALVDADRRVDRIFEEPLDRLLLLEEVGFADEFLKARNPHQFADIRAYLDQIDISARIPVKPRIPSRTSMPEMSH